MRRLFAYALATKPLARLYDAAYAIQPVRALRRRRSTRTAVFTAECRAATARFTLPEQVAHVSAFLSAESEARLRELAPGYAYRDALVEARSGVREVRER